MDEKEFKDEELLKEINEGIARQVADEMDEAEDNGEEPPDEEPTEEERKKKLKKRYIIIGSIGGGILLLILIAVLVVNSVLDRINHEKESDINFAETDLDEDEWHQYQQSLLNATEKPFSEAEDEVINILLIGEEAIHDSLGRSDSMMIASINKKEKTLSLTSVMRDIYVKIPGYKNNKLNAAYNNGGGVLLTQTIEENFAIEIDGYVRVNFEGFEKIIDQLGGVDIELTSSEASYLNSTNYISNPRYRNVAAGWNSMNGNQALGYCRVRYRSAGNGERDDFGRTYRQRTVLMAIFNKYKTKNPIDMVSIASSLMDYVTTNLTKNEIISYATTAATLGTMDLRTFRIPMNNTYLGEKRYCGSSRASVLVIDYQENISQLRNFIYGEELAAKLGPIPTTNDDIGINGTSGKISSDTPVQSNQGNTVTVTPKPAPKPTAKPTAEPTRKPKPTAEPTPEATAEPTLEPTIDPSAQPSDLPAETPSVTAEPQPTAAATAEPAGTSVPEPTVMPEVQQELNTAA